ncbi:acyl carrier protein [Anthocerotibacter panamensis]|uniref:acyl carrier protein n=1 Tax=Anthocerotibacter panamensis TaxID=2857077 RepID=UPI001C403509|nr:phosphopantetheine-binding protein [Anthocerotibacter panamensis]
MEKLQLILRDLLKLEHPSLVTEEASLVEDLAISSLAMIDFVVSLEEHFPVLLPSAFDPTQIHTVGDMADLILALVQQKRF